MKTKLVNAGLKTSKKAYQRMLDGEQFIDGDYFYKFDGFYFMKKRINWTEWVAIDLGDVRKKHWKVEKRVMWEDEVSYENPVLCWVSDQKKIDKRFSILIAKVIGNKYQEAHSNYRWAYATPVKPEDLWSDS